MKPKVIYYEFAICHCQIKPGDTKRSIDGVICPEHRTRLISKCLQCQKCGKLLYVDPTSNMLYCDHCKKEIRAANYKAYVSRNKEQLAAAQKERNARKKAGLPKIGRTNKVSKKRKKHFDQSRRGTCAYGSYCIDKEVKTGKRFNCYKCKRFRPLELDILDYMQGVGDNWENAKLYSGSKKEENSGKLE